ncbi:MAG: hypothetical protein IH994_00020 [Proteobacteria bacterium]|nr:hypothetical protein [Pseudomonadota bacterium]
MTLEHIHAIIVHAPPDFSLPHQVMQVRQRLGGGKKELIGVELALEQLPQDLDPGSQGQPR